MSLPPKQNQKNYLTTGLNRLHYKGERGGGRSPHDTTEETRKQTLLNVRQRKFIQELCFLITFLYILKMCGYPQGPWWNMPSILIGMLLHHILFSVKIKSDTDE